MKTLKELEIGDILRRKGRKGKMPGRTWVVANSSEN